MKLNGWKTGHSIVPVIIPFLHSKWSLIAWRYVSGPITTLLGKNVSFTYSLALALQSTVSASTDTAFKLRFKIEGMLIGELWSQRVLCRSVSLCNDLLNS